MKHLVTIKFKYDNRRTDFQLMVFAAIIILGGFLSLLYRTPTLTFLFITALIIQLLFLYKPDGRARILVENGKIFLAIIENRSSERKIEVISYKFRWNYHFLETGKSESASNDQSGHVNFIFTRVEFKLINDTTFVLGKELYQWKSIPKNWEYELFVSTSDIPIGITSYDLAKLKADLKKNELTYE